MAIAVKPKLHPKDIAAQAAKALRLEKIRREAEAAPLLPCPFCGSDAILTAKYHEKKSTLYHAVICVNFKCGCALSWSYTAPDAVQRWNRRVVRLTAILKKS